MNLNFVNVAICILCTKKFVVTNVAEASHKPLNQGPCDSYSSLSFVDAIKWIAQLRGEVKPHSSSSEI